MCKNLKFLDFLNSYERRLRIALQICRSNPEEKIKNGIKSDLIEQKMVIFFAFFEKNLEGVTLKSTA